MLTVLPLLVVPVVLAASRLHLWGRISIAALGLLTLANTYGLATAGRAEEITIAVDPFDMSFPAFQGLSGLFPLYTWWTTETWWLTFFWLALAVLATGAVVWPDVIRAFRRVWPPIPKGNGQGSVGPGNVTWIVHRTRSRLLPWTMNEWRENQGKGWARLTFLTSVILLERVTDSLASTGGPMRRRRRDSRKSLAYLSAFAQCRFSRYHATVRRTPSSTSTSGVQLSSSRARLMSAQVNIGSAGWRS